jgi:DHA1 family bicyclomycin/chloramphenicol resistance-like MFS transporter
MKPRATALQAADSPPDSPAPSPHRAPLSLLLGLLSSVGAFTIDAYFPSMRAIAHEFHLSAWQVQQTLTVYMFTYALAALFHGSLSDALGRRRPILACLGIYTLASIGCAAAPNFATLLAFRAVQGVVAGGGQIIGRAIVRDSFHGPEAQRLMSMITMIFGLGPAAAPIIGGWVYALLGWRAVFGTMALLGFTLLIFTAQRLSETHPRERRTPLQVEPLLRHNFAVLRHPEFLLLALASGLAFIALHVYVGSAPAIVLDHWQLDETMFAALNLPIICGYCIGAVASGRLAGRVPPQRQARFGFQLLLVVTALMLLLQWGLAAPPIYLQQLLLALIGFALQLMYPIVTLRVLDLFPDARGAAASMQSFFSLFIATITMGLVTPLLAPSMIRIALVSLAAAVAAGLMWRLAQRYRAAHAQLHS